MSYVAIARKWRPRAFDDIAGQGHVTRTLQNAIRLGRIHHAFLFTGARGVGKTSAARVLSRALNCESGPTPSPCGSCAACAEILAGSSPDVIEIDGASNNSVDDMRELRESVPYLPQRGRSKVYIIDEVHMLSKGAFNALLKTLEEPPAHVVFIFATTEPQKIPDTILSRVQRFDFKRIPESTVVETLRGICEAEGVSVPDAGLRLIARAGEGSMRDSQSLLDRVLSFSGETLTVAQVTDVLGLVDRGLLYEMLDGIIGGEPDRCLAAIERVHNYGYDLSEFTSEMLELIRNATLVGLSPTSDRFLDVPDDEQERLRALVRDTSPDVFVQSFHVMMDVHEQVARAPRPRLVLEMAVARLISIRPARSLEPILSKLGVIERRLRQSGARAPRGTRRASGTRGDDEPEPAAERRGSSRAPDAPTSTTRRAGARSDPDRSVARPRTPDPAPVSRSAKTTAKPEDVRREEPTRGVAPWRRGSQPNAGDAEGNTPPAQTQSEEKLARPSARTEVDGAGGLSASNSGVVEPEVQEDDETSSVTQPEQGWMTEPIEDELDAASPEAMAATPAPVAADAPMAARAEAFQQWVDRGHQGLNLLAWHSVIVKADAPYLDVVMADDFHAENVRAWADDPWVAQGLQAYFPGCKVLRAKRRPEGSELVTRQERKIRARQEQISNLRSALANDSLVQRLTESLGARMVDVVPDGESPTDFERLG